MRRACGMGHAIGEHGHGRITAVVGGKVCQRIVVNVRRTGKDLIVDVIGAPGTRGDRMDKTPEVIVGNAQRRRSSSGRIYDPEDVGRLSRAIGIEICGGRSEQVAV